MRLTRLGRDLSVAGEGIRFCIRNENGVLCQIEPHLRLFDLGVIYTDACLFRQEVVGDGDRGRLSSYRADQKRHSCYENGYLLSPVSFLKAQPRIAIFLPVILKVK